MTLWQGRLGSQPAEALMAFTASLDFDRRLASFDLAGSRAHVRGLERAGILTGDEVSIMLTALKQVERELEQHSFVFGPGDEDIHTAIERRVTEIADGVGAKLHSGRSRNDQVATAMRLYTKHALLEIGRGVVGLQHTLLARAEQAQDAYLPGYTHMQRAQPVLLAHHLLAHGQALARDVGRLLDAVARMDVSPLGAGALAGSALALDPDGVATDLGFAARFENSLDAVSDRDFVAEALFALAVIGLHLSRIGEEVVLWSSAEFGFMELDDAFATGSSMLPQKKNPDIAELARGKAGRLVGHLAGFLTTLKGLPLSYNRDLQEDKEPLFDAVDQLHRALAAIGGLLASARFDLARMQAAADETSLLATDLAEWLVARGMPWRTAHELVGAVVRSSAERHLPLVELIEAHPDLGSEALFLLEPGTSVSRHTSPGGAGPVPVARQLERFRERLEIDLDRLDHAGG